MSPVAIGALAAVVGYLVGSVSFARVIARLVSPERNIEDYQIQIPGSRHSMTMSPVSGTTVGMQLGAKWGGTVAILDILKVALPALVFRLLYPDGYYHLILGVTGLVGHNWPLYHRFKGGRGLSPIYGGFLVMDWLGTLITSLLAMFLGMVVFKLIMLCYLGGLVLMIPWTIIRWWGSWPHIAYVVLVNVMFALSLIPEAKANAELKRRMVADGEKPLDLGRDENTPQGRMMTAFARRMGFIKDKEPEEVPEAEAK